MTALLVVPRIEGITMYSDDSCVDLWEKGELSAKVEVALCLVFHASKIHRKRAWYEDSILHVVDKVIPQKEQAFTSGRGPEWVALCGERTHHHPTTLLEHVRMWHRTRTYWRLCKRCVRPTDDENGSL